MITLSASKLSTLQRCPRRYRIESEHVYEKWQPKALFDALLRRGIFDLSSGADAKSATVKACTQFFNTAKSPGIDVLGHDPYKVASDYTAMLQTVLEAVSRLELFVVQRRPNAKISDGVDWQFSGWQDQSGTLHRWITVDKWDQDRAISEAHSWQVAGDVAVGGCPMTLHIIEIGQMRNGRRESPWSRTYKHPVIANRYQFKKKSGRELGGEWTKLYFADSPDSDAKVWVDLMVRDGVIEELIKHCDIKQPSKENSNRTLVDIRQMAQKAQEISGSDLATIPMYRTACDGIVTCVHQLACYTDNFSFTGSGLYHILDAEKIVK